MAIKCLAFDLDGTLLLDGSKKIDPRTFDSIQKAMAQGMHIVIASGRDKNGCKFVYEPLGLENGNHFLALVNGQIIYDFENKEYDLDDVLTTEDGIKAALSDYDVLLVGPDWLEIMPKHVSKASALWKICDQLGISMNEVMAFGDAQNDLKMLQQVGIGVAMGNAMDEAKYAATVVTDTNMNNGIGKVIDALLAGKEMDLRKGLL